MISKTKYSLSSRLDLSGGSVHRSHTAGLWALQLPFYLEGYGFFFANEGYFTERTGLRNYLLLYTTRGRGIVRTGTAEVEADEDSLVVIDCMAYQYYRTISQDGWDFRWFHFYGASADLYCKMLNGDSLTLIKAGGEPLVLALIEGLFEAAEGKDANVDLMISEMIMRILTQAIQLRQSKIITPKYEHHFNDISLAVDAIHRDFSQKLSLEDLSGYTHMSKYHFLRVFKSCTGQTPYEYLLSCRISESKKLLQNSNLPVSEVSFLCGFPDASNFIRCFKRACGTTPSLFRKDRTFLL
ncbi:MAG: helix-turn-helix transcriptional regulator [Saccharofermentanales bacterium]